MKVTHRIPTTQYGYVEVEEEISPALIQSHLTEGEKWQEEVKRSHDYLLAAFAEKPESTMTEKEFTDIIYGALHATRSLSADQWESLSPSQQSFLKCLKNAMNRKPL